MNRMSLKKIFYRIFFFTLILLHPFINIAQQKDDPLFQIIPGKGVGAITDTSSIKDLYTVYGEENFKTCTIDDGEGSKMKVTVMFQGSEKEIMIHWRDTVHFRKPVFATLARQTSLWKTPEGIHCGTTLKELTELNGRDFYITGCCYDTPFAVIDWNKGNLESLTTHNIYLRLQPFKDNAALNAKFFGDKDYSTNDKLLEKATLKVNYMIVWF
jgi:hypothetical protein